MHDVYNIVDRGKPPGPVDDDGKKLPVMAAMVVGHVQHNFLFSRWWLEHG